MVTINDKIKACDYVLANMLDEQERIIYRNENKIIVLNTSQFDDGMGSDGKVLNNTNPIFDGIYSLSTALLDDKKRAGDLYNFNQTGAFLSGVQVDVLQSLTQINIFSTGTGAGDKNTFFTGYTNLFGLDQDNKRKLEYEIIKPELLKWIKIYL